MIAANGDSTEMISLDSIVLSERLVRELTSSSSWTVDNSVDVIFHYRIQSETLGWADNGQTDKKRKQINLIFKMATIGNCMLNDVIKLPAKFQISIWFFHFD